MLVVGGLFLNKLRNFDNGGTKVEVLSSESETKNEIIVEVNGSVGKPGVYKLPEDSRVEDALTAAGGISAEADFEWVDRTLNRASKLVDGQKIYIPTHTSTGSGSVAGPANNLVNINTASLGELDTLSGIGPVTAQKVIEQRPYSSVEELLTKGVLSKSVYEKNKNKLTIF